MGQLLKRQYKKTIAIWVLLIVLILILKLVYAGLYFCGYLLPVFPFAAVLLGLWIWGIYDAYHSQADWR